MRVGKILIQRGGPAENSRVSRFVFTDTLPTAGATGLDKVEVLSVL
ncbi:hypothetical protein AB0D91_02200 [Streptomyces canus]